MLNDGKRRWKRGENGEFRRSVSILKANYRVDGLEFSHFFYKSMIRNILENAFIKLVPIAALTN